MTANEIKVRVWVTDVWDTIELSVTPDHSVADVKAASLKQATGRQLDPNQYAVKFRGAVVLDESESMRELNVPDGAPMIVVPTHRRPVR